MRQQNKPLLLILVIFMAFFIVLFFGCSNHKEPGTDNRNNEIHEVTTEQLEGKEVEQDDQIAKISPFFQKVYFPAVNVIQNWSLILKEDNWLICTTILMLFLITIVKIVGASIAMTITTEIS